MEKFKPKIFVSYTIRDGKITESFLTRLCGQINDISDVYIDLIHNDSITNKQRRVINEIYEANFLFLIKTEQIENSEWVCKEISLAKKLNIPILEFEYEDLIEKELQPFIQAIKNIIVPGTKEINFRSERKHIKIEILN